MTELLCGFLFWCDTSPCEGAFGIGRQYVMSWDENRLVSKMLNNVCQIISSLCCLFNVINVFLNFFSFLLREQYCGGKLICYCTVNIAFEAI